MYSCRVIWLTVNVWCCCYGGCCNEFAKVNNDDIWLNYVWLKLRIMTLAFIFHTLFTAFWWQTITWTSSDPLSVGPLRTIFSWIWKNSNIFQPRYCIQRCRLQNTGHFQVSIRWKSSDGGVVYVFAFIFPNSCTQCGYITSGLGVISLKLLPAIQFLLNMFCCKS